MALVRLLYFCDSTYNINVCIICVPGICNNIDDSLSFPDGDIQETGTQSQPTPQPWPAQTFTTASCDAGIIALPSQPGKTTTNQGL